MKSSDLIRRSHRYLGLFIGIQFLLWTISGLYFTWTDIDEIHGDHLRKAPAYLSADIRVVSPGDIVSSVRDSLGIDSVHSVRLFPIRGKAHYQISYFSGAPGDAVHAHVHHTLADATTGRLRGELSRDEAVAIAREHVAGSATPKEVTYLSSSDDHHEYRERPLPAWAVSFEDPACTVYVSAEQGTFQTIRHDGWRVFDALWMTHTMGYESRDDINNALLRFFSVLALITILSGFALYIVSSRSMRKAARYVGVQGQRR